MDHMTTAQRSYTMAQVRSKNTKLEVEIIAELKKRKIKFETHFSPLLKKTGHLYRQWFLAWLAIP